MSDTALRHVFVVGLDAFNAAKLQATTRSQDCTFVPLLEHEEVRGLDEFHVEELLDQARIQLGESSTRPSAVCSFWDFPVAEMVSVLTEELGLPGPSLDSVVRVHHKYWSRLIQQRAAPEVVPAFCAIDPFDTAGYDDIPLDYPFWIKPVRSFRSHLAFRVRDAHELDAALARTREEIARLGEPYGEILDRICLPDEVAGVDGWWCLAEQAVHGRQCTLEGYVHEGRCVIYGIVDSVRDRNRTSFRRYEYPSHLPRSIQRRMVDAATRVVDALGYDGGPFNLEFFWDRGADHVWLLEANARQSQSHADLFEKVDGVSNHEVMVDLALGEEPAMPFRQGKYPVAAKWFVRAWDDGVVTHVPSPDELAELARRFPDSTVLVEVAEGDRLSQLPDQDAYSYELATLFSGATSRHELLAQHRSLVAELPIHIAPVR